MKRISSSLVVTLLLFATALVGKGMHDTPPPTLGPNGITPPGFEKHEEATTSIASDVAVQILAALVASGVIP